MSIIRQILLRRVTDSCNDSPAEAVRPFDADATGTAVAEGGGLFILEEYEQAKKRGAKMYAELVGFGASQDTYSVTVPDPSGHSYSRAISKALAEAGVSPADVGLLIPHGLGIPSHDRAEIAAVKKAFGEYATTVPFAPIKAQTGNTAAGSGVDAAATVLSLFHGQIPGSLNTKRPIDGAKLNTAGKVREAKIDVAVSSVYSLGGQNAALVFRSLADA
jgi:3-oxoacyl-[acyl-carrier-protein] synthase II